MFLAAAFVIAVSVPAATAAAEKKTAAKEKPAGVAVGKWVEVYRQKKGDPVRFMRQQHGGSCFDSQRGLLVLFGSNTHGRDWTNSPLIFDPEKKSWARLYPNDSRSTYAVNAAGIPVAGANGAHPWATHTFGAVVYDSKRDEMVVCCMPGHMVPGRFTNAVKDLWPKIKKHPTWTFSFKTGKWTPLPCKPVSFFPNSCAYDSKRGVVIGHRPNGVFELRGEPRHWVRVTKKGLGPGWGHDNCVFDSRRRALVVFGTCRNSNEVGVYRVGGGKFVVMKTPGVRPPKDQHVPMAYAPDVGRTVALVDHTRKKDGAKSDTTETWLYDLGDDAWTQLKTATLPFACGMNYNLEYDRGRKVLWLVTGGYHSPTVVWTLKLTAGKD